MRASQPALENLSRRLWKKGVAAFCPTTLSAPPKDLLGAVARLGRWIRSPASSDGAKPLGIHLEGPFIASGACGAHPLKTIRPLSFEELNRLWEASLGTLKILTIAPEPLSPGRLKKLAAWSKARQIVLSLGHSRATFENAKDAFDTGFRGITHAWNALAFHHRDPGPLGAAIGKKDKYLELMIDGVHVSREVVRWTRSLHPAHRVCFVSDCVPAGGTRKGSWHPFGPLHARFDSPVCRLPNGHLAGGGLLLSESYCRWLEAEAALTQRPLLKLFHESRASVTEAPLWALSLPTRVLRDRKIQWEIDSGGKISLHSHD